MSPDEAADRLAIRGLVDAYARCADRRDAKGQMALFAHDAHFVVYYADAPSSEPQLELGSRDELAAVFDDLNQYRATTHFNGQSTFEMGEDWATGETYCLAHHIAGDGDAQTMFVASIRYEDTFAKADGTWLFAERKLHVDWTDTYPLGQRV